MSDTSDFNEVFSSKIRLGIMTLLVTTAGVDFTVLKNRLNMTDGNLGAHMRVLEDKGYVQVEKGFFGRRPKTTYTLTDDGRTAFLDHLHHLEMIIRSLHLDETNRP
jgi:DNA-binding MarR family transcriptional regulator